MSAYIAGNLNNESIAYDAPFLKSMLKQYVEHLIQRIDPEGEYFDEWWHFRGGKQLQRHTGGEELVSMKHSNQLSRKVSTVVSKKICHVCV